MAQLNVIIPGLFGPFSSGLSAPIQEALKTGSCHSFFKRISQAKRYKTEVNSLNKTLLHFFNAFDYSTFSRLSSSLDQVDDNGQHIYCVDPVHFRAESDHAVLLGNELLSVQDDEADQLIKTFNLHFEEDGVSLSKGTADRWYLHCSKKLELVFCPLDDALGRDIKHFMPKGDDALWWRRIVNEAQMLFFQHDVNAAREDSQQLTINGLWLWDMDIKQQTLSDEVNAPLLVFSEQDICNKLAISKNIKRMPVESFLSISDFPESSLLLVEDFYAAVCYGDEQEWLSALEAFCQSTFITLMEYMKKKHIDEINLLSCDGQIITMTSMQSLKFWQKKHPVSYFMQPIENNEVRYAG